MHVTDDLEAMGPIDYLVVEFPGSRGMPAAAGGSGGS
jgi:hypothetical protein